MAGLAEILGQERAVETLQSALRSGRVHHAWVFQGPPGVGKFTAARAFAATLLDPSSDAGLSGFVEPDPESETQRMVRAGTHPDLHIVRKELARISEETEIRGRKQITIPKEVIEEFLIRPAQVAPAMGGGAMAGKAFIVDEAELLAEVAQNAVLKTLEEPAERTVIILVTSSPEDLLPTIRSRCQRVSFEPLPDDVVRKLLKKWQAGELRRAGEEGGEAEAPENASTADAAWAERFAAGSPGRAIEALEGGFAALAREIEPMLEGAAEGGYDAKLGPAMAKFVGDWAEAWVKGRPQASKDAANKAAARHVFTIVSERLRVELRGAEGERDMARLLASLDAVDEAERRLDSNVSLSVVMEALSVELTLAAGAGAAALLAPASDD